MFELSRDFELSSARKSMERKNNLSISQLQKTKPEVANDPSRTLWEHLPSYQLPMQSNTDINIFLGKENKRCPSCKFKRYNILPIVQKRSHDWDEMLNLLWRFYHHTWSTFHVHNYRQSNGNVAHSSKPTYKMRRKHHQLQREENEKICGHYHNTRKYLRKN